jgi:uncharacterized protein (TIGR01244 family)
MKTPIQVSERIFSGDQPDEADLRHLAEAGFRSVINLRKAGEPNQPLSPQREQTCAEENGLNYASVPVVAADLRPEIFEQLRAAVEELPAPIYVHCAVGQRAAALAVLCANATSGASGDVLLRDVADKGVTIVDKNLISFVRSMADLLSHDGHGLTASGQPAQHAVN